jgi:ribosome-associated protein
MTTAPNNSNRDVIVNRWIRIPGSEFTLTFSRSSGPGGQNVNKVNTKVTLRWNVTDSPTLPAAVKQRFLRYYAARITESGELVINSQKTRSQPSNASDCLQRVHQLIAAVAVAPKIRRKTRPSKGSRERRLESKRQRSSLKRNRRDSKRPPQE